MFDFLSGRRPSSFAERAMVATSHPLASAAALAVLSEGGNAVDSALAAVAVQCVADPHMTGIGGDCFVLYAPKGGAVRALNGSGRAPGRASPDALRALGVSELTRTSPHAITIPGAVSAWCRLHEDHGSLPLDRLFAPAIRYAEHGFPVTARVARDWARSVADLCLDPYARAQYLPGDTAPKPGERRSHPALGATLRGIAASGAAAFYTGPRAVRMAEYLQSLGGLQTEADFHDGLNAAEWGEPIGARFRNAEVLECAPNGQGLAALMILRILDGFDLGPDVPLAERIHLHAEATKLAYHHRDALIADPAHSAGLTETLLAGPVIDTLRARIDLKRAGRPALWSEPAHRDTIYLCVVDAQGNAISFINSIFHAFGSTRLEPETGVLFHSRGSSFRLDADHPNAIGPGKRPLHTIIPGMMRQGGRYLMPFGVMGGHYQAAGHAAFLSGILDQGLDLQTAIDQPRCFAFDGVLEVEATLPEDIRADLAARGHVLRIAPGPMGGAQAIRVDLETGVLEGGSDSRKDGMAIGF